MFSSLESFPKSAMKECGEIWAVAELLRSSRLVRHSTGMSLCKCFLDTNRLSLSIVRLHWDKFISSHTWSLGVRARKLAKTRHSNWESLCLDKLSELVTRQGKSQLYVVCWLSYRRWARKKNWDLSFFRRDFTFFFTVYSKAISKNFRAGKACLKGKKSNWVNPERKSKVTLNLSSPILDVINSSLSLLLFVSAIARNSWMVKWRNW